MLGIFQREKALELAQQEGLDLVEVAPQTQPPVCRIIDFSKFKYEEEKKERQILRTQRQHRLKEVRLKPNIEEHDYQVKLKAVLNFLKRGNKVKINLFFRGREITHLDLGKKILDRFISDIKEIGNVEREPVLLGRVMSVLISPKSHA
jgi:translation initiation factor IF-3